MIITFFLVNAEFQVMPLKSNVVGQRGKHLELDWRLNDIPAEFKVDGATLFYNKTNRISEFRIASNRSVVLALGKTLFSNRINVSLMNDIYKMRLTNLKYSDVGEYLLVVQIARSATDSPLRRNAVINISSIVGECGFFILSFFCW